MIDNKLHEVYVLSISQSIFKNQIEIIGYPDI